MARCTGCPRDGCSRCRMALRTPPLRRQLESQVDSPFVGFAQPFGAALQATEMVFAAPFAPLLGGMQESLVPQPHMRLDSRHARPNRLACNTHDAHELTLDHNKKMVDRKKA